MKKKEMILKIAGILGYPAIPESLLNNILDNSLHEEIKENLFDIKNFGKEYVMEYFPSRTLKKWADTVEEMKKKNGDK